jgi:hypothetical protein
MSWSSSSSSRGTIDSAAGELLRINANATPMALALALSLNVLGADNSYQSDESFVPMVKSYSTNSSPVKQRLDRDADDDVFMTTMRLPLKLTLLLGKEEGLHHLSLDPFGSKPSLLCPMANSTTIDSSIQESPVRPGSIRFAKNVTFHEYGNVDSKDRKPMKRKSKRYGFFSPKVRELQSPSSDYSATPDNTDLDCSPQVNQDHPTTTPKQQSYAFNDLSLPQAQNSKATETISSAASSVPESIASIFSPVELNTAGTAPSANIISNDKAPDEPYDPSLSLAKRFDKLTLGTEIDDSVRSRDLFSLRLQKSDRPFKPQSAQDESFDQVDILDQLPPNLPNLSNSNIMTNESQGVAPLLEPLSEAKLHDPSLDEVEVKRVVAHLLELLGQSSDGERSSYNADLMSLNDMISKLRDALLKVSSKLEKSKIQQIKAKKQLIDFNDLLSQKETDCSSLNAKIKLYMTEIERHKGESSKLKSHIDIQDRQLSGEKERNAALCEELDRCRSSAASIANEKDRNGQTIKQVIWIIQRYSKSAVSSVEDLIAQIKNLVSDHEAMVDELSISKRKENLLRSEVKETQERCQSNALEIRKLQGQIQTLTEGKESSERLLESQSADYQSILEENKRYKELLKSLEVSYSEQEQYKNQYRLEIQRFEEQAISLKTENGHLKLKAIDMENVLNEQMELVTSAQSELEQQSTAILSLQTDLEQARTEVESQKATIATQGMIHTQKCNEFERTCEILTSQIHELQSQTEMYIQQKSTITRQKDDEIKEMKRRLMESQNGEAELSHEIKNFRLRLSEKFTETKAMERKLSGLSKAFQEIQDLNRTLRTEALRNGVVKQELKRSLAGLSIGVLKDFEGIIDATSLNTVRDGLQSIDSMPDSKGEEENQLEKLNDAALFIEEAVHLVVSENWSLCRRLSTHQKGALVGNGQHFQSVIDTQSEKIKKMESKISNYESVLRKISRLNQRDEDGGIQTAKSSSQSSVARSEFSDNDHQTIRRTSKDEIQRILTRMKKD